MPQNEVIFLQISDPHEFSVSAKITFRPGPQVGLLRIIFMPSLSLIPGYCFTPKRLFHLSSFSVSTGIACPLGCLHGLLIAFPQASALHSVYTEPRACSGPLIPLPCEPCSASSASSAFHTRHVPLNSMSVWVPKYAANVPLGRCPSCPGGVLPACDSLCNLA